MVRLSDVGDDGNDDAKCSTVTMPRCLAPYMIEKNFIDKKVAEDFPGQDSTVFGLMKVHEGGQINEVVLDDEVPRCLAPEVLQISGKGQKVAEEFPDAKYDGAKMMKINDDGDIDENVLDEQMKTSNKKVKVSLDNTTIHLRGEYTTSGTDKVDHESEVTQHIVFKTSEERKGNKVKHLIQEIEERNKKTPKRKSKTKSIYNLKSTPTYKKIKTPKKSKNLHQKFKKGIIIVRGTLYLVI